LSAVRLALLDIHLWMSYYEQRQVGVVEALCSAGLEVVLQGLNQVLGEHDSTVAQTSLDSSVMSEISLLKEHENLVTG